MVSKVLGWFEILVKAAWAALLAILKKTISGSATLLKSNLGDVLKRAAAIVALGSLLLLTVIVGAAISFLKSANHITQRVAILKAANGTRMAVVDGQSFPIQGSRVRVPVCGLLNKIIVWRLGSKVAPFLKPVCASSDNGVSLRLDPGLKNEATGRTSFDTGDPAWILDFEGQDLNFIELDLSVYGPGFRTVAVLQNPDQLVLPVTDTQLADRTNETTPVCTSIVGLTSTKASFAPDSWPTVHWNGTTLTTSTALDHQLVPNTPVVVLLLLKENEDQ